jgi:hypothetical protein
VPTTTEGERNGCTDPQKMLAFVRDSGKASAGSKEAKVA